MRYAENIKAVEACGADWMGFIFYPRSPRYVESKPSYLPQCKRIGVFVNATLPEILAQVEAYHLYAVQLHGTESPALCAALHTAVPQVKIIKVFSIGSAIDTALISSYDAHCDYYLFDTACKAYGGSGKQFNWDLLAQYHGTKPFLLSGGLTANSVEILQTFHHPQWVGIDLNSGFEVTPAIKNPQLLKPFIEHIHNHYE